MEVVCGRIYKYVVQEVVTHAYMWMSKHWCAPNQVLREDKNVAKENYGVPISYVTKKLQYTFKLLFNTAASLWSLADLIALRFLKMWN